MRYLSSYDNLLREGLTKAEAEMQLIENLKEKKLQGGEEIRSSINQMVGDMRAQLNNLEKWITAMQESLRKAKEISDISGVNRESKKQVLLKSPYLGKIDGYDKDNFGTTYRFKTKLGIVTFVFIPNRTNQDLSPKTLANLQEIFIKCTRKVYGGLFGVLRRPVRKEYGVSEPLFIDSKGFPCDTFSIGGIGYFTKLEDKSLDDCIGHAKRNIAYSWRVMQKKPKYFELIDPPYIFATARKDKSGIVVSENRGDSLNLEYFRKLMDEARPADGTPNEDIIIRRQYQTKSLHTGRIITTQVKVSRKLLKESEILPKVYARLANKNGLSYDQFIDLLVKVDLEIDDILSRQMREIERSYELKYRQYKNPDVPLTYLGVDLEFGMIFVRGYNSESGRMLLSFLDQTH